MRIIVCDTGPILHLREANLLELLQKVGRTYIPKAIDNELRVLENTWCLEKPEWIHVKALSKEEKEKADLFCKAKMLDRGEAEQFF
ncbi:MAG: hypothetical protein J7K51_02325 [Thermotogae bacterium]|nr:hypothetical protein [Thermotogota bacterium]